MQNIFVGGPQPHGSPIHPGKKPFWDSNFQPIRPCDRQESHTMPSFCLPHSACDALAGRIPCQSISAEAHLWYHKGRRVPVVAGRSRSRKLVHFSALPPSLVPGTHRNGGELHAAGNPLPATAWLLQAWGPIGPKQSNYNQP